MIQDSDFSVLERVDDMLKFSGTRRVYFTTNVFALEIGEGRTKQIVQAASANVIDNDDKLMYRCYVIFDNADISHYGATAYGPQYSLPYKFNKKGERLDEGVRLKDNWFEIEVATTIVDRSRHFDIKTGNFDIVSKYRLMSSARSLRKIDDIDPVKYQLIVTDRRVEVTVKDADEELNFDGTKLIHFTSNIYNNSVMNNTDGIDGNLAANAIVDGYNVKVAMFNLPMKSIAPTHWANYWIYKPILTTKTGRELGATVKNHDFTANVIKTHVFHKYVWDETRQVTKVSHSYMLLMEPASFQKA